MKLFSYFRSSAAWRVRIALAHKGIPHGTVPVHLVRDGGQQHSESYRELNPQGFVPALEDDGQVFAQSLAIIEYLEETHPEPPLLPPDFAGRARVRQMAFGVACDIHPLQNLRVLNYLRGPLGQGDGPVADWVRHWIAEGFRPLEELARRHGDGRTHLHGGSVTMADVCLVPQMYNARRWHLDLKPYPALVAIDAHLMTLPAFSTTRPEAQADAE
ncbi:MAG TPA: maleylacetoacetate isomerase [Steroidobacteraceae bacterium]|nr:maleylacetoacetate isomerase [Steroidobacteraceae bacterium]